MNAMSTMADARTSVWIQVPAIFALAQAGLDFKEIAAIVSLNQQLHVLEVAIVRLSDHTPTHCRQMLIQMVIVRVWIIYPYFFENCMWFKNSEYSHPLTVPDNGRIIGPTSCVKPDYGRAFLGVNCRFMCSPNFSMIGASSTTCGMNGWSTRAPRCIKAEVREVTTQQCL